VVQVVCFFCMAVLEGLGLVGPGKSGRWVLLDAVDIMDKRTVEWLERYPTEDRGKKAEDDEKR
jgi:hypothetical protein